MPVELFAQTKTDYEDTLTLGPSQQIQQCLYVISNPYAAAYQLAKLTKAGAPEWDLNDLTALGGEQGSWNAYGIRFKSFDPANPTTVKAQAIYAGDPTPIGATPSGQNFNANGVSNPLNVITGIIPATGVIPTAGSGFTYTHTNGTGVYVFTFTTPFANAPVVVASAASLRANNVVIGVTSVTANGFTVATWNPASDAATDIGFSFLATPTS
jgi:hypothetical protein